MGFRENEAYHEDKERVSNSMLSDLIDDPKMFRDLHITKTRRRKETRALLLGTLVHALVLEPFDFDSQYVEELDCDYRLKSNYFDIQEHEATARRLGQRIIKRDLMALAREMATELIAHDELKGLFQCIRMDAEIERRIDFEMLGVPCRCKPDFVLPHEGLCVDIKTAPSASPVGFGYSVDKWGYHRQEAFYLEALKQKYGRDFRFLFAVVESAEPFNVSVQQLSEAKRLEGRKEIEWAIGDYQARKALNNWLPSWSSGVQYTESPKFYNPELYAVESGE